MDSETELYAHVKRFYELWMGDDRFRAALLTDARAATIGAGLNIDPDPLAFLWNLKRQPDDQTPEIRAFSRMKDKARDYFDFTADDDGAVTSYRVWRARQVARSAFALGAFIAPVSLHLPFAVELTRGCSLGCWFCGLSASRLERVLPTDLDRWEQMLHALVEIFGASAVRGFLFWATDPLDHPDYEAHAEVFRRILGRFPTTTTAAALVDPDRTRRLMACAQADPQCLPLRFSVVSRRLLERLHATFSAQEIADIGLVMVNRESVLAHAEAGRAREQAKHRPERAAFEQKKLAHLGDPEIYVHRTIACVSGFLIEPVAGRVRLISPEPCSDRWPDGYVVFDEAHFEDADEFAYALRALVERNMGTELPVRLALQRGVEFRTVSGTEIRAECRGHWVKFGASQASHLPTLAEAFRSGALVEDTIPRIAHRFGITARRVREDVTELWQKGVLIEPIFAETDEVAAPPAVPIRPGNWKGIHPH